MPKIGVLRLLFLLIGHVYEQIESCAIRIVFDNRLELVLVQPKQLANRDAEFIQQPVVLLTTRSAKRFHDFLLRRIEHRATFSSR